VCAALHGRVGHCAICDRDFDTADIFSACVVRAQIPSFGGLFAGEPSFAWSWTDSDIVDAYSTDAVWSPPEGFLLQLKVTAADQRCDFRSMLLIRRSQSREGMKSIQSGTEASYIANELCLCSLAYPLSSTYSCQLQQRVVGGTLPCVSAHTRPLLDTLLCLVIHTAPCDS